MAKRMRTHEEVDENKVDQEDLERDQSGRFVSDDDDDEMTAENPDDEDVDSDAKRGTTPKKK
jgi:hypothetical protein